MVVEHRAELCERAWVQGCRRKKTRRKAQGRGKEEYGKVMMWQRQLEQTLKTCMCLPSCRELFQSQLADT